ncbi:hypothetical protein K7X08_000298 [Anisodus acutangulus]|uniref:Uncharacterized protein n=1 Tax=Anisodus acutangulus TaxID=402998 RepID=A0A9Q1RAU5_9SOLA|nr:hypothetical protein K7X08_000298 [Anisodus acutangulus]
MVEKNVGEASAGLVILDDTPIVARRPLKKAKACHSSYVTNFESDGTSIQAPVVPPTKPIFLIKHPFEVSIESAIDLNLTKRDYGVFAAAFAKYLIEGREIPKVVNDIDDIRSRYGVLL